MEPVVARASDLDATEVRFARGAVAGVIVVGAAGARGRTDARRAGDGPGGPRREAPWLARVAAVVVVGGTSLLDRIRSSTLPVVTAATVAAGFTVLTTGLPEGGSTPAPSVAGPRAPGQVSPFLVREAGDGRTAGGEAAPPARRGRAAQATAPAGGAIARIRIGDERAGVDAGGVSKGGGGNHLVTEYVMACATGERTVDPGGVHPDPNGPVSVRPPSLYCEA